MSSSPTDKLTPPCTRCKLIAKDVTLPERSPQPTALARTVLQLLA